MKKLMFYCQHILGMGHLVRSMEIVRGLVDDFQVCFLNGGEAIQGFQVPSSVEMINLPAIKTDAAFRELRPVDPALDLEDVQNFRKQQLLDLLDMFQPDVLMVELFPFGRRRFSFELIPLMEAAKSRGVKIVCSLRDIVVTKQNKDRHEAKICGLMNQYFDQLLIHGDPALHPLEDSFTRVKDLSCPVHYTGYVAQRSRETDLTVDDRITLAQHCPMILVSVGGGRFGHELLDCVVKTAPYLQHKIPHHFQVFTGPFIPEDTFIKLQTEAQNYSNVTIERYTTNFLAYMKNADLSISMSGYNTTMNILTTGVRAMMHAFTGNDDQEQTMRCERLEALGIAQVIQRAHLTPDELAPQIQRCLASKPTQFHIDMQGVKNTARLIRDLLNADEKTVEDGQDQSIDLAVQVY